MRTPCPISDPLEATNYLARQALQGDDRQFAPLYERIAPALYAWVHLKLGRAAHGNLDPEDVVQEVWLRAVKAFSQFDPTRGPFRGWIFQVTKYTLLDTYRALAAASHRPSASSAGSDVQSAPSGDAQSPAHTQGGGRRAVDLSQVPDQVTSFTQRIERNEALERFHEEVASWPKQERELLVICGLEGRPTSEAAGRLGLNHETTRKRWLRLRQRLSDRPQLAELIA